MMVMTYQASRVTKTYIMRWCYHARLTNHIRSL